MKKIITPILCALLFVLCFSSVDAQQPMKVARIGFLDNGTASGIAVIVDTFRPELRKLGWTRGKESRYRVPIW